MIIESLISVKCDLLKEEDFEAIFTLIEKIGFSLKISSKVTAQKMIEVMGRDKKAVNQTPRFVLLEGIGKVASFKKAYCQEVEPTILHEALAWMITKYQE